MSLACATVRRMSSLLYEAEASSPLVALRVFVGKHMSVCLAA